MSSSSRPALARPGGPWAAAIAGSAALALTLALPAAADASVARPAAVTRTVASTAAPTSVSTTPQDVGRLRPAAVVPGLKITVPPLQKKVVPLITVTGPKQPKAKKAYAVAVGKTMLLPRLAPGKYIVTAKAFKTASGVWTPVPAKKVYVVTAKAQTQAVVTYKFTSTGLWNSKVSAKVIKAAPVPDVARAVSALIPRSGGTITARSASGVTFTLTVPNQALLNDTTITLTPLAGLGGVAVLGKKSYGVQLSPDGQQFTKLVKLSITPPTGTVWPIQNQVPISIEGAKHTVGLAAVLPKSKPLVLQLTHFSSYAVMISTLGYSADLKPVRALLGGTAEQRIESALAEKLGHNRVLQLVGADNGATASDFLAYIRDYYDQVLKLRIAAAKNSCAAGRLVKEGVLSLERQLQFLGGTLQDVIGKNLLSELESGALGDTISDRCMFEEYQLCAQQHIVTRLIPQLLGILRQEQLLGMTPEAAQMNPRGQRGLAYAQACLNFEIDMAGTAQFSPSSSNDPPHTTTESVSGRVLMGLAQSTEGMDAAALPSYWLLSQGIFNALPASLDSTGYSSAWTSSGSGVCWTGPQGTITGKAAGILGSFGFTPLDPTKADPDAYNKVKDFAFSFAVAPLGVTTTTDPNTLFSHYTATENQYDNAQDTTCNTFLADRTIQESYASDWLTAYAQSQLVTPDGLVLKDWTVLNDGSGQGDILAIKDIGGSAPVTTLNNSGNLHAVLIHKPLPPPAPLP